MEKTFNEILVEKMNTPINTRDKKTGQVTGQIMPAEAMVLKVLENATAKGDIQAISFIKAITEHTRPQDEAYQREQQQRLDAAVSELQAELHAARLPTDTAQVELTLMARQLVTLRQIAATMDTPTHQPLTVSPHRDGREQAELSPTCRIYNDLYKAFRRDWQDLRQQILQSEMQKKMLK